MLIWYQLCHNVAVKMIGPNQTGGQIGQKLCHNILNRSDLRGYFPMGEFKKYSRILCVFVCQRGVSVTTTRYTLVTSCPTREFACFWQLVEIWSIINPLPHTLKKRCFVSKEGQSLEWREQQGQAFSGFTSIHLYYNLILLCLLSKMTA